MEIKTVRPWEIPLNNKGGGNWDDYGNSCNYCAIKCTLLSTLCLCTRNNIKERVLPFLSLGLIEWIMGIATYAATTYNVYHQEFIITDPFYNNVAVSRCMSSTDTFPYLLHVRHAVLHKHIFSEKNIIHLVYWRLNSSVSVA